MNHLVAPLLMMSFMTSACQAQGNTAERLTSPAYATQVGDTSAALAEFVRDLQFDTSISDTSLNCLRKTLSGEYRFSTDSTRWEVSGSASNRIHLSAPKNMSVSISVRTVSDAVSLISRTLECNFTRGFVVRLDNRDLRGGSRMTRIVSLVFPARNSHIMETRYYYTFNQSTFELDLENQVCVTGVFAFPEDASPEDVREFVSKHYGTFISVCRRISSLRELGSTR